MEHRRLHAESDQYPVGLRDLEDPPPIHVAGLLEQQSGVAVVGTRRCTRYGLGLAEAFGSSIARAGWTVVSGLARGIDAAAHRGCLRSSGHAVAVLGCGIDVCYPAENKAVYDEILSTGGAIVSEYPSGTPPDRWRFPARNRLIAAISGAVIVVEAAERGGALITARLAAEMGRPVLAVPGDVDREASVGCNMLIRDGAIPVLGADDLLEALSLILGAPPAKTKRDTTDLKLPEGGVRLDDLPVLWSMTTPEALSLVGRLEIEGRVRREGDMVKPA